MSQSEEAHLLRTRLEAGGVPAYVQDEHTVQMDWLWSNATGGVSVQINECDLERVREIYQDGGGEVDDESLVKCPTCQSADTERVEWSRRLSFFCAIVASLPRAVARMNARFHCRECCHRWRQMTGGGSSVDEG